MRKGPIDVGSVVRITDGEYKGQRGTVVEVHTGPNETTWLAIITDEAYVEVPETDVKEVR